jgi:hypothetical protein
MTAGEEVTKETEEAERREAQSAHESGPGPTPGEAAAADRARETNKAESGDVAEHYEEMIEIGAKVKGEGEVD